MLRGSRKRNHVDQARLPIEHGLRITFKNVQRGSYAGRLRRFPGNPDFASSTKVLELLAHRIDYRVHGLATHTGELLAVGRRYAAKHVRFTGTCTHVHCLDVCVESPGDNQRGIQHVCAAFCSIQWYQDNLDHST